MFRGDINPDLHPSKIEEGWHYFIDESLTGFLEKATGQVIMERTYNAPVEKVWQALTNVDQMRQWYMPLTDFRPEPGFATSFDIDAKGERYKHIWKVTEVIPNKKISYEWRYGGFPGNSLVTFELTPRGKTTHLKLTHVGLATFEGDKNPALKVENFENGWNSLLGTMLLQFLEKEHTAVG
ncbi:MAG: SRPBCC domain-containing protein [Bacteroidetes bacterium]|nr:SRPBCC domain-containing protein [Bacteroidota bacterium]